ncbi:DUF1642 domain-containing protein [Enterococcus casseliflavus]|uniref:DUF1642 domain-containing protein n=1 Tax=Enterococcus casseliflavus TaxID=37734 RepID=UPI00288E2E68|nr:DUF1642 domain-containing protein [Enterococcus casseliflavus]MDT2990061.1 DUF1642 domain-containing protein [Enterococcus casseliflavus]
MNKQELIEKVTEARSSAQSELNRILSYRSKDTDYDRGRRNAYAEVETWIEDLDKVQKVVVKKFVAEWFEEHKNSLNDSLWDLTIQANENSQNKDKKLTAFEKWFIDFEYSYEYLIRMKNGYEVEKELLYKVIIDHKYLVQIFSGRTAARLVEFEELTMWSESAYKLTEETIKSIDERYWAFAVPVEEVK